MVTLFRLYIIYKGKMADILKIWNKGIQPLYLEQGVRIDIEGVIGEKNQLL